jgi:hypothetical protein
MQSHHSNAKYANGYKIFDDHAEICIINQKNDSDDYTIIIDKESVEKCKNYIWHVNPKKMEVISSFKNAFNNKRILLLERYLTKTTDANTKVYLKIISLDYRLSNFIIHPIGKSVQKTVSQVSRSKLYNIVKYNKFCVNYLKDNKQKLKNFAFTDETKESALQKAIEFRNSCKNTPRSERNSNTGYDRISECSYYVVSSFSNKKQHHKIFYINKKCTDQEALEASIAYRNSLFEKEN